MTSAAHEQWDDFPAGTSLVRQESNVPDLATPQQIAAFARAFDEQAFLASIVGEAMDKWFYSFPVAGKTVEGVSVVGAEEFARLRAEQGFPIRFPAGSIRAEEVTRNGELGIQVTVVAREARSGADGLGMAFYPYMVEREKNGEKIRVPDNFPDRKALSVAKRNAILDLIPIATVLTVLKQRRMFVAQNEQRETERVLAVVEGRKDDSPRTVARTAPSARQLSSGDTGATVMRFGKTKGTPLANLELRELTSARKWAAENNAERFADAIGELDAEIARRSAAQSNTQGEIPGMDAGGRKHPDALAAG
jgi:hypothetical protein